jgi:hypothetical protein
MHRIPVLFLPDIRPAGYPANPKAGYRISGRISAKDRIPVSAKGRISGQILGFIAIILLKFKFIKTALPIIDFCKTVNKA